MKTKIIVGLLLTLPISLPGENLSSDELNRRMIERRAIEAVTWGMPAVNYDRMLQAAIDNGAKLNQVVYWSEPANWRNQTLTPNLDTIYLNPFYDTRKGAVVLEIPPAEENAVIVGSGPRWPLPDRDLIIRNGGGYPLSFSLIAKIENNHVEPCRLERLTTSEE